MGSIFSDQDKDSVSKRCAPREDLGELCQQITNEGSIEILRKTVDDTNELFFVDGGNVIDENGVWAFQIPMNLDYVVTDEEGNIVPSNDPSIGIPTRAKVRFRIGMNDSGDLGRLRTRAKYLVPNNPQTQSDIDYSFDESTVKESSFRDLYWNKIYSVTNFIPRYQKVKINIPNALSEFASPTGAATELLDRASTRNFTGIKNIDACSGDKTPFPYNRVNTKTNPLFRVICVIIKIIAFLVSVINYIILPLINALISVINFVIGKIVDAINKIIEGLNFLGLNISEIPWNGIPYSPCIVLECGDGQLFSPGCSPNFPTNLGFEAAVDTFGVFNYCQSTICLGDTAGLDDCIAFQLATALKLYEFDFYNDWVNGTLYSYLVKYKKKPKGREKFCEYDCDGNGGVDGNEDGVPDNNCHRQILLDGLYPEGNNSQNNFYETGVISEGLIKKNEDTLYYASSLRNASQKLFATDIICLGSVFECDWQGFPKINQYLIPSSYKIPPAISELGDDVDDVIETGMLELNSYGNIIQNGLFFSINCLGLRVDATQALNIRHICEIFVETDQAIEDEFGNIAQEADGVIGSNDIDGDIGKEFRDAFLLLNIGEQTPNSYSNEEINSNFNTYNFGVYDFTALVDNGTEYINFRGYPESNDESFSQPKNSYFMYFGLVPGKTAVDVLNQNFFTQCAVAKKNTFIIDSDSTADINNNGGGTITFTFIGGFGPFTYTINGPNGYSFTGTLDEGETTVELTGLLQGNYTITATDSLGNPVSQNVFVSGPIPLFAFVEVTQNDTSLNTQNGQITINNIVGGTSPYFFTVTDGLGNPAGSPSSGQISNLPLVINGLGSNTTNGYTVLITDNAGNTYETDGLIMTGVEALSVESVVTPTTCYNGTNGSITLNISGGYTPYTIVTTGPNNFTSVGTFLGALGIGTYVTNLIDAQGNSESITNIITSLNPQLLIQPTTPQDLLKQCNSQNHHVRFFVTSGLQPNSTAYISYQLDNGPFINTSQPFVSGSVPLELVIPNNLFALNVKIKVSNTSNYECFSNLITINKPSIATPISNLTFVGTETNIAGFNWEYDIDATGGILPYSSIVIRDLADNLIYNSVTNPQYLVSSVNNANGTSYIFQMPFNGIKVKITDNVGCEFEQTIN
jgi:hypothetical protein